MDFDLDKFFNLSLDMLCIAGFDGYFKLLNPSFSRILGWSSEQLLEKPFVAFIHPEDVEATTAEVSSLAEGKETLSFTNRYQRSDETYRYLLWTARADPKAGLIYAIARDITELRRSQQRFAQMLESSPSAMLMVSAQSRIVMMNRESERLLGYKRSELLDAELKTILPERVRNKHGEYCGSFFDEQLARPMGLGKDLTAKRKDGSEFPVEIGLTPVETEEGKFVLCALSDLTVRKEAEAKIRSEMEEIGELVNYDPLTGIFNRRALFERLRNSIEVFGRSGGHISYLMMDIDKFKSVNDTYGHQEGDRVLKEIAGILTRAARNTDVVGRYGGEEFSIILSATSSDGAVAAAEKVRTMIETHNWPNRPITASFGASTAHFTSSNIINANHLIETMISQADKALYVSKESGRNRTTHHDSI